ncbi:hypothetical protein V8E36_004239 [Tilletia maclaganii]
MTESSRRQDSSTALARQGLQPDASTSSAPPPASSANGSPASLSGPADCTTLTRSAELEIVHTVQSFANGSLSQGQLRDGLRDILAPFPSSQGEWLNRTDKLNDVSAGDLDFGMWLQQLPPLSYLSPSFVTAFRLDADASFAASQRQPSQAAALRNPGVSSAVQVVGTAADAEPLLPSLQWASQEQTEDLQDSDLDEEEAAPTSAQPQHDAASAAYVEPLPRREVDGLLASDISPHARSSLLGTAVGYLQFYHFVGKGSPEPHRRRSSHKPNSAPMKSGRRVSNPTASELEAWKCRACHKVLHVPAKKISNLGVHLYGTPSRSGGCLQSNAAEPKEAIPAVEYDSDGEVVRHAVSMN